MDRNINYKVFLLKTSQKNTVKSWLKNKNNETAFCVTIGAVIKAWNLTNFH